MTRKIFYLYFVLMMLPFSSALEGTCSASYNFTTPLNITNYNQTINVSTEFGSYAYNNSVNITDNRNLFLLRNISCSYNLTEGNMTDLWRALDNISKSAEVIAKDGADRTAYFGLYTGCLTNLSGCNTELGIEKGKADFQGQYNTCNNEKADCLASKNSLNNQLSDPVSGCQTKFATCDKAQQNANDHLLIAGVGGIALGMAILWAWKIRPKTGRDPIEKEPMHYD